MTGTLGILDIAATRRMIELRKAIDRLKQTSFRCRPEMLEALLARHSGQ